MQKNWQIKPKYPQEFEQNFPGYHPAILQLLFNRNLTTQETIDEFLNPDFSQDVHNPFLFQNMEKAVKIIKNSLNKQEQVLIYGDYDADGVTSSVLLYSVLQKIGFKNIGYYIPHREDEGYGLNLVATENFVKQKIDLVITVDCGIANIEEVSFLKKNKIKVIVTDHHLPKEKIPPADAILDPWIEGETYPFKKLAGVGVAFKLAQALFKSLPSAESYEAFEKWLLDLVTLGTIGDVAPIIGENRTLSVFGLKVLNKTCRQGLRELIRVSSLDNGVDLSQQIPIGEKLYQIDARNISFGLVPRINSAGRIDHANLAFKLLTTTSEIEALATAQEIQQKNTERQKTAEEMLNQALKKIGKPSKDEKILIASAKDWSPSLVGLVAGKLSDRFYRPVILFNEKDNKFVGSARSIPECHIVNLLKKQEKYLARFGGHAGAAGMTIEGKENFLNFVQEIKENAAQELKDIKLLPKIDIETELELDDINWGLYDEIRKMEPFAEANPTPLFLLKDVLIDQMDIVGKNSTSLRFYLSKKNKKKKAISFGTAKEWSSLFKTGDKVDAVVELGVNEWNGNRELQLKIIDLKK